MATYFVDFTGGSDGNSGLSELLAWKTIGKANGSQGTGNTVRLKPGEKWREVAVPATNNTWTNYGTGGVLPLINGTVVVTGWAGAGPTYTKALTSPPNQVFVGGVRAPKGTSAGSLTAGQWFWAASVLTYRPVINSNPDTQGLLIEADDPATLYYGFYLSAVNGVVIDGIATTQHGVGGIFGENASFTVRNCEIRKWYRHGVAYHDAVNNKSITVEDNLIEDGGSNGIHLGSGAQDCIVRRNEVRLFALRGGSTWTDDGSGNQDYTGGIKMAGATCLRNVVENNIVHDGGNQLGVDAGAGIWCDVDSDNHIWRFNLIYNVLFNAIRVELSDGVLVHHNVIIGRQAGDTDDLGISVDRDCHNNLIYHNVVWGCSYSYTCQGDPATTNVSGNIFKNNIGMGFTGAAIALQVANGGNNPSGQANLYQNNCFVEGTGFINWGGTSYNTIAAWQAAVTGASGNIGGNPLFVDAANGDFRLQAGSPCIDAAQVIPGVNDGYSGPAPDIGRFETGQFTAPVADISDGGWTNQASSNVNLYQSVDESVADDADYIQSALNPVGDEVELKLASIPPPGPGAGTLYIRHRRA